MSKLHHLFLTKARASDIKQLFTATHKLSSFCTKLEKLAQQDPDRYPTEKYLGDGFELFVEVLLKLHPCDNRLGVYDYVPNQVNDNGVDGTGVNVRLEACVVQVKYRSNTSTLLTATKDSLSNLFSSGDVHFGVTSDREDKTNYRHYVFTTAKGLHFYTDLETYGGRVKCFGYNDIRGFVDNNHAFWKQALALVQENLKQ